MPRPPVSRLTACAVLAIEAASVTSRRSGVSSPTVAASLASDARPSLLRPVAMTWNPRSARYSAAWRPMPLVAPVMRTTGLRLVMRGLLLRR